MTVEIIHGDCRKVMDRFEPSSFDVCVTDPPYGMKFLGKEWDHGVPGVQFWQAIHRVLKPGAFLMAFGGTRTHHRLYCAIEDAGFAIKDTILWLHEGFPKGSNLKPSWEPIALAHKSGPGELNIDGARIQPSGRWPANLILGHHPECKEVGMKRVNTGTSNSRKGTDTFDFGGHEKKTNPWVGKDGKEQVVEWKCHPDCPVSMLDEQAGIRTSGKATIKNPTTGFRGNWAANQQTQISYPGSGGASRFFYHTKANPNERFLICRDCNTITTRRKAHKKHDTIFHPTQKPLGLMRYLIQLITPPGGSILDPFVGSGSTIVAAKLEGFNGVGIDDDADYIEIANHRLKRTHRTRTMFDG